MPELLAPAGSMEALRAAVCAGADAVYLGAASFGARAAVGFGPDELREAIRFALKHAESGDVVVLAGKGHETYQEIDGVKHPFDEKVVVQELLEALALE